LKFHCEGQKARGSKAEKEINSVPGIPSFYELVRTTEDIIRLSLRVKKDGTSKLLNGVHGTPIVGAIIKISGGNGHLLIAKVTANPPSLDKPAEAEEI
jgi:hypothetical protein